MLCGILVALAFEVFKICVLNGLNAATFMCDQLLQVWAQNESWKSNGCMLLRGVQLLGHATTGSACS